MDDGTLEREIEALLAIDPAPDFRARLRGRLDQERAPVGRSAWFPPSWKVATGALALAAIVMLAVLRVGPSRPQAPALRARSVGVSTHTAMPGDVKSYRFAAANRGNAPVRIAMRRGEPDIVIDAVEAAAWRRLLNGISEGRVEIARVAGPAPPPELHEEFALPPVRIEPLIAPSSDEGVHP